MELFKYLWTVVFFGILRLISFGVVPHFTRIRLFLHVGGCIDTGCLPVPVQAGNLDLLLSALCILSTERQTDGQIERYIDRLDRSICLYYCI